MKSSKKVPPRPSQTYNNPQRAIEGAKRRGEPSITFNLKKGAAPKK